MAFAFAVLVGLGFWQLQRLEWKQALIDERIAQAQLPPAALPDSFRPDDQLDYRRIALEGTFLHDRELYLDGRPRKGEVGLHVVTPLVLPDGRTLLVDRGWAPKGARDPATRAEGQIEGEVRLEGALRRGGWGGLDMFRPANQPDENIWLWTDLAAMAAAADLENPITEVYLIAGPQPNPGGLPIGRAIQVDLPNDHLGYALTWFGLAGALLIIAALVLLKKSP
ncbi:MAG: SURF1 family protein [Pseudomonadota bacterium]